METNSALNDMKKVKVTGNIGGRIFKAFTIKGFRVQFDQNGYATVPDNIAEVLCKMAIYNLVDES